MKGILKFIGALLSAFYIDLYKIEQRYEAQVVELSRELHRETRKRKRRSQKKWKPKKRERKRIPRSMSSKPMDHRFSNQRTLRRMYRNC